MLREQAHLLDLTHDTIIARNEADQITFWNHGAEALYGWRREQALGKTPSDLLPTVYPVPLQEVNAKLTRDGHWEGELVKTRKDGTVVTVASRWSVRLDEGGRRIGTLETNNDITERKRAEEALRRSQAAYLTEAQKLSATGSFGWNITTNEVFWSDQTFSIFAYEPSTKPSIDLCGRSCDAERHRPA
jgi:PAS domain S-box-containing protein